MFLKICFHPFKSLYVEQWVFERESPVILKRGFPKAVFHFSKVINELNSLMHLGEYEMTITSSRKSIIYFYYHTPIFSIFTNYRMGFLSQGPFFNEAPSTSLTVPRLSPPAS